MIALERADALLAEAPQATLDRMSEHEVALRGVGRRVEIERQEGDVRKILELGLALRALCEHGESSTVNRWLSVKFPDNLAVRLMQAGPLANVRRWPEVIELLCSVDSRALAEDRLCHR